MNLFGRIFLNSRKDRRKDEVLLDVEELTLLINIRVKKILTYGLVY